MPNDTSFGEVRFFEDFLEVAVADIPNISVLADGGGTAECVAGSADGRLSLVNAGAAGGEIGAVTTKGLNWTAGNSWLKMEARLIIDDITDYTVHVGFGNEIATGDSTAFTISGDVESSGGLADTIGFYRDGDATTDVWRCMAQNASSITANQELASRLNPVAAVPTTLTVYLSLDRKSAVWSIDGEEVYRVDANTDALVAAVDLVPGVWVLDEGTATTIEIDYLYCAKGRSAA